MPTVQDYGSYTAMTVTALNSLANSATVGWQSDRVDNLTTKALDYEILVELDLASTAPANDMCVYVFAVPWVYDGSTWHPADGGTATRPSGSQSSYTIGTNHNLRPLMTLAYTATGQVVSDVRPLSAAFGGVMPDGWSLVIVNYSGAALAASANVLAYRSIKAAAE